MEGLLERERILAGLSWGQEKGEGAEDMGDGFYTAVNFTLWNSTESSQLVSKETWCYQVGDGEYSEMCQTVLFLKQGPSLGEATQPEKKKNICSFSLT